MKPLSAKVRSLIGQLVIAAVVLLLVLIVYPLIRAHYLAEDIARLEQYRWWLLGLLALALFLPVTITAIRNRVDAAEYIGDAFARLFLTAGMYIFLKNVLLLLVLSTNLLTTRNTVDKEYVVIYSYVDDPPMPGLYDLHTNQLLWNNDLCNLVDSAGAQKGDTLLVHFNKGLWGIKTVDNLVVERR